MDVFNIPSKARAGSWRLARSMTLVLVLCGVTYGQSVVKQTFSSAGTTMRWDRGSLTMTVGQTAAGRIANSAIDIHNGFLPPPRASILSAGVPAERILRIYPQPARDNFTVELPSLPSLSLQLYDISGKVYLTEKDVSGRMRVDLPDLPPGGYFLRVLSGGEAVQTKLITIIR